MHGHGKRRGAGGGRAIVDALAVLEREYVPKGRMVPAPGMTREDRAPFRPECSGYGDPYTLPASGTIPGERVA